MNTEKLLAVTSRINSDLVGSKIMTQLKELSTNLQNHINSPNETYANGISKAIETIISLSEGQKYFHYPETWKSITEYIGIDDYVGESLKEVMVNLSNGNEITFALALKEVNEIVARLEEYQISFKEIASAFSILDIKPEKYDENLAELSILVPRNTFENELGQFGDDIKKLDKNIKLFSEIYTGSRENPTLREISTTDPVIFAGVSLTVALGIIKVVRELIGAITDTYKMRQTRAEAIKAEFSAETIKNIDGEIAKKIEAKIDEIVKRLVADYNGDTGRRQELKTESIAVVRTMAAQIDNGYRFAATADEPEASDEDVSEERASKHRALAAEINSVSKDIDKVRLPGQPVLLLEKKKDKSN